MKRFLCLLIFALAFAPLARALDTNAANAIFQQGRFDQNLGASVPLDAVFRDESGQPVALRSLLGQRPAVLVLGYHECPMLCSLVLGGLVESMNDLRLTSGGGFDLLDVSINPADTPARAAQQKRIYFKRYSRHGADAGWHFLTSPDPAVTHQLADAVGFHYAYDAESKQYAHPSGVIILTPDGKVARYFFGINYDPGQLQEALQAAGRRTIGARVQDLLLTCFHYSPINGKYGALAGGLVYLVHSGQARSAGRPKVGTPLQGAP